MVLHTPVNVSVLHFPMELPYQSQSKFEPEQNSDESQSSMLKNLQPFPLPHVDGSVYE